MKKLNERIFVGLNYIPFFPLYFVCCVAAIRGGKMFIAMVIALVVCTLLVNGKQGEAHLENHIKHET